MCPRSYPPHLLLTSLVACLATACGYDWGTSQRVGSCSNCEMIVKVEGIFEANAVPAPHMLMWEKEPLEAPNSSLLRNFSFRDSIEGWSADTGAIQEHADAALSTTGSSQCQPAQAEVRYQLWASARMSSHTSFPGVAVEFFDAENCTGPVGGMQSSPPVEGSRFWSTLSLIALSPPSAHSMRIRLFTRSDHGRAQPGLFDNVILRPTGRSAVR